MPVIANHPKIADSPTSGMSGPPLDADDITNAPPGLTSRRKDGLLSSMKRLAPSVQLFAVIAVLVTHPIAAWYCLAEGALCDHSPSDCCQRAAAESSCCGGGDFDADTGASDEMPCCVEIASEWQILPGSLGAEPPEPAGSDLLPLGTLWASIASPAPDASGRDSLVAAVEPPAPPPPPEALAVLCRRLI